MLVSEVENLRERKETQHQQRLRIRQPRTALRAQGRTAPRSSRLRPLAAPSLSPLLSFLFLLFFLFFLFLLLSVTFVRVRKLKFFSTVASRDDGRAQRERDHISSNDTLTDVDR